MLLQEIRDGAVDGKTDISTVLRKSLVLATKLDHEGFKTWVEKELNGYGPNDELPPYRVLHVQSLGDFVGPFHSVARGLPIPPKNVPEKFRKVATTMSLTDTVAGLSTLLREREDELIAPWPADLTAVLADKFYEGMNLVRAWRVVPRNLVAGVIDTVRNRLLGFVLEIEKQYPEAGEKRRAPPSRRLTA
jgi:hypothetical protein